MTMAGVGGAFLTPRVLSFVVDLVKKIIPLKVDEEPQSWPAAAIARRATAAGVIVKPG